MPDAVGLTRGQSVLKRALDLTLGGLLLIVTSPVIVVASLLARVDTGESGVFKQRRVGRAGELFEVRKIRTMRTASEGATTVTAAGDARITRVGAVFRKLKIDELPQLLNVVRGEMSLVGPRPDVPGFADRLQGADRLMLSVRPGITGPASLAYRHEELLLQNADDPERFNREVLWPDKVRINCEYVRDWSLRGDMKYIVLTVASIFDRGGEVSTSAGVK